MQYKESAAQKKRHPFTIKNGASITHIYCVNHPDSIATFYCASCAGPYDEACVGREEGEKTICQTCDGAKNKPKRAALIKWLALPLLLVTISLSIYYILNKSHALPQPAQPQMSEQIQAIVLCRQRLEKVALEAAYYHATSGAWPLNIHTIKPLFEDKSMLLDPLTNQPFEMAVENGRFTVYAPAPDAYGLRSIYAIPGKPARMKYIAK